jgi:predicted PurR-regulated permease PerM
MLWGVVDLSMRANERMVRRRFSFLEVAVFGFLILTAFLSVVIQVKAETEQTPSQLTEAESMVKKAFSAVLKAEDAGANVTDLLSRLSYGMNFLAQAEMAYNTGDVSGAANNAVDASAIASEVETDALDASYAASTKSQIAFWPTVSIVSFAEASFVLFMFLSWRRFRKNYIKRLSNSKAEVTQE